MMNKIQKGGCMEKLQKLFGGYHFHWKTVLIFAAAAGIYTGLINQVAFLNNTSFRDIAVTYEVWMLFAVVIAVNCEKPLEAAMKVFVFFLVSQSLCFIVEIPWIGKEQSFYYFSIWFRQILLTCPGGYVAYYAKCHNIWGAIIVWIAVAFEAIFMFSYGTAAVLSFPHHLLTTLLCLFTIFCFIEFLIKNKIYRIIAICAVILSGGITEYQLFNAQSIESGLLPAGYTE